MRDLCETIKTSALSLPTRYHDQLTEQRAKPTSYIKGVRYDNILVTGKKTKFNTLSQVHQDITEERCYQFIFNVKSCGMKQYRTIYLKKRNTEN